MLKGRDLQKEKVVAKPWKLNGVTRRQKPWILNRDGKIQISGGWKKHWLGIELDKSGFWFFEMKSVKTCFTLFFVFL